MLPKQLPKGIRYIGWLEKTGGHLVQHRREEAIIISVYQGYPDLFIFSETVDEVYSGEPSADNNDVFHYR
jgi:hypothetical protein